MQWGGMRWAILAFGLLAMGCATKAPERRSVSAEAPVHVVAQAERCTEGASVHYARPLPDGARLTVVMACRGEPFDEQHVEITSSVTAPRQDAGEEESEGPEAVELTSRIDVRAFNDMRSRILGYVEDGKCRQSGCHPWALGIGTSKYRVMCDLHGGDDRIARAVEWLVRDGLTVLDPRDMPAQPGDCEQLPGGARTCPEPAEWIWGSEYWRDEIGFYRRTN